jgi:aminopeptidase N
MEAASGRPLERFFERWVLDTALPRVRLTTAVKGEAVEVAYEQAGDVFDIPLTITLHYTDGTNEEAVVLLTEASGSHSLPLRGPLRSVDVNRDDAALGTFERR